MYNVHPISMNSTKHITMKNIVQISLLSATIAAVALGSGNVLSEEADTVVISFDHPQSISVSAPQNTAETASGVGNGVTTLWTITSNNAVGIQFSGKSASLTTANAVDYPVFYKAEVDATGAVIANRYDHLLTSFGVDISGYDSFAGTSDKWQGGNVPTGTPANLVVSRAKTGSPGNHFNSIMPSDAGVFDLTLTSQGVGDASTTQSGDYLITVTATVTAEEQGDTTLDAATL